MVNPSQPTGPYRPSEPLNLASSQTEVSPGSVSPQPSPPPSLRHDTFELSPYLSEQIQPIEKEPSPAVEALSILYNEPVNTFPWYYPIDSNTHVSKLELQDSNLYKFQNISSFSELHYLSPQINIVGKRDFYID